MVLLAISKSKEGLNKEKDWKYSNHREWHKSVGRCRFYHRWHEWWPRYNNYRAVYPQLRCIVIPYIQICFLSWNDIQRKYLVILYKVGIVRRSKKDIIINQCIAENWMDMKYTVVWIEICVPLRPTILPGRRTVVLMQFWKMLKFTRLKWPIYGLLQRKRIVEWMSTSIPRCS